MAVTHLLKKPLNQQPIRYLLSSCEEVIFVEVSSLTYFFTGNIQGKYSRAFRANLQDILKRLSFTLFFV